MDWDLHGVHITAESTDAFLTTVLTGGMDDVPGPTGRAARRCTVRAWPLARESLTDDTTWHKPRRLQIDKGRLSMQVDVATSQCGTRLRVDYAGRATAFVDYERLQIELAVHDPGYFQRHFDPLYTSSVLFKSLLLEVLPECGIMPLHAGMCAVDGAAIIVCGAPGVGKTSLLLALTCNGFSYLSDELGFVRADADGRIYALSFPIFGKVAGPMARRVPDAAVVARPDPGVVVFTPTHLPVARCRSAPAAAVVRVTGSTDGRSELSECSELDTLAALLEYDVYYGERHSSAQFEQCAELAAQSRGYDIVLGNDLDAVAPMLAEVVRDG